MIAYDKDKKPNSFAPLSSDEILKALETGREQNNAGKGIPFEEAIKRIGLILKS